ncbi:MAG: hypothetical protein A2Z46_02835 [Nitrospirae bacterium RBG_19FT_COMBO_55_12]|nr:MAG: hypothetical protein A2Z46_02835 [Nitrospirae bacterium RBG_19FT_COMBO_55_12]
MTESPTIGGQAVLEGVMMRSPHGFTVAVRKGGKPGAEIVVLREALRPLGERFPLFKKRIIRGAAALFEAMWLGVRALNFSANEALEDEDGKKEELGPLALAGTMVLAIAFALGLFLALPLLLTNLLGMKYGAVSGNSLLFNLTDGVLRVALFLGYVSGISFMKDIRRVFEYHGAEHKAIAAYEAGVDLTVENAKRYSCIHPRCGTSFLLAVAALSIIVFSLIPGAWPLWAKAASRVALLPVIAGLSYEFIKYTAKKRGRPLIELVIRPGLWLQRLTTREPSGDQIEVAVRALNEALALEPR